MEVSKGRFPKRPEKAAARLSRGRILLVCALSGVACCTVAKIAWDGRGSAELTVEDADKELRDRGNEVARRKAAAAALRRKILIGLDGLLALEPDAPPELEAEIGAALQHIRDRVDPTPQPEKKR